MCLLAICFILRFNVLEETIIVSRQIDVISRCCCWRYDDVVVVVVGEGVAAVTTCGTFYGDTSVFMCVRCA